MVYTNAQNNLRLNKYKIQQIILAGFHIPTSFVQLIYSLRYQTSLHMLKKMD